MPTIALVCGMALALVLASYPADGFYDNDDCDVNANGDDFLLELRGQVIEVVPSHGIRAFSSAMYDLMDLNSAQQIVHSSIGVNGSIIDGELEFIAYGIPANTDNLFSIDSWFDVIMGENVSNISNKNTRIIHLELWAELPEDMQEEGLVYGQIVMDYASDSVYRVAVPIFVDRSVSFAAFEKRTPEDMVFEFTRGWNVLVFEYNLNDEGEVVDTNVYAVDLDDPILDLFQFVVWWLN